MLCIEERVSLLAELAQQSRGHAIFVHNITVLYV